MSDIQIILIAFAAVIATALLVRIFSEQPKKGNRGQVTNIDDDLLRTCCGDQAMADRLVQHELDRKPQLSRKRAAFLALARLRNDKS